MGDSKSTKKVSPLGRGGTPTKTETRGGLNVCNNQQSKIIIENGFTFHNNSIAAQARGGTAQEKSMGVSKSAMKVVSPLRQWGMPLMQNK
jgi:hypothetical protein